MESEWLAASNVICQNSMSPRNAKFFEAGVDNGNKFAGKVDLGMQ